MLIITPQMEVDQYYESDRLNQSTLKYLLKGLSNFLSKQESQITSPSLVIGSAVDCMLTSDDDVFDKLYHISSLEKKPSDTEISILNLTFEKVKDRLSEDKTLSDFPVELGESIVELNWYSNRKLETNVKNLTESGKIYFEELKRSEGKTVIDITQYQVITSVVNSLRENPVTKCFFDRDLQSKFEDTTVCLQYPIYFNMSGIECKALLDIVYFEVEDDVLTVFPMDIKTTARETVDFPDSVRTYRYDIQAAWYKAALEAIRPELLKQFECKTMVVAPFRFIVESTTNPGQPLVFVCTQELLNIGFNGREAFNLELIDYDPFIEENPSRVEILPEIKGLNTLLDEYTFYVNNGWHKDKRLNNLLLQAIPLSWKGIDYAH